MGPASAESSKKFDQLGYVLYTGINLLGDKRLLSCIIVGLALGGKRISFRAKR